MSATRTDALARLVARARAAGVVHLIRACDALPAMAGRIVLLMVAGRVATPTADTPTSRRAAAGPRDATAHRPDVPVEAIPTPITRRNVAARMLAIASNTARRVNAPPDGNDAASARWPATCRASWVRWCVALAAPYSARQRKLPRPEPDVLLSFVVSLPQTRQATCRVSAGRAFACGRASGALAGCAPIQSPMRWGWDRW